MFGGGQPSFEGPPESGAALLVIDPNSRALLFLNDAALELFEIDGALGAEGAERLLPELADLEPRDFATKLERSDGTADVTVHVERLKPGPFHPAAAVSVSVRRTDVSTASDGVQRGDRLQSLWNLAVRRGFGGTEQVRAIMHEGSSGLGLGLAVLGRIEGDTLHVAVVIDVPDLEAGASIPLGRTPVRDAVRRAGTFAALDTLTARSGGDLGMRSFLTSIFRLGDEQWAVVFGSAQPRDAPFDDDDWRYVEHLNEALARAIERRESDARIEQLAYFDTLTSLPNRAALLARLDETIVEAQALSLHAAVLFVDIDGFKAVNDTIGHRGGDAVLAEVAARLRSSLRREEFIGRLGGDEFAIVMSNVGGRAQIESIAHRFAAVLTNPFTVDDRRFALSASIGVAVYPDDATTREELLAVADAAMYQAKAQGGSRIRFRAGSSWAAEEIAEPFVLPDKERDAQESASYLLTYQPVVDSRGEVLAAEALIRRVHARHGLLAPEHGWSISRDDQTRRAIDRWVLRESASQARAFAGASPGIHIDVNLAAYDAREIEELFADPTMAGDLERIRIEIAVSAFVDPSPEFATFVERCVTAGIEFVLDRLDGGLAPLQSLAHLPVRVVKLDRTLVDALEEGATARALIEGTIVVARSLGWQVVAKGVETRRQRDLLVTLGVDGVQGFEIAHPMTAIDFGNWLRSHVAPQDPRE